MKRLALFTLLLVFTLSFSFSLNRGSFLGLTIINPATSSIGEVKPQFFDTLALLYSVEKNADPANRSPLSYGFSLLTNMNLPDSEGYQVRGMSFDIAVKIFGITLFNEGEKLQVGFEGSVLLLQEIFKVRIVGSTLTDNFSTSDFDHYNKIIIPSINLIPGLRVDLNIGKNSFISGRVGYAIPFYLEAKTETGKPISALDLPNQNSLQISILMNTNF
ncbi:hypothetical protein JYK00_09695 [Thermosipho ferrireducens]|uniref:Outer membrane protein beta-barrel domain-containing protein n=1 Tax=Thermosipho ferrireducens TaxID=2571116 RepID=A0ABX7S843_9BACT|nr:hypothetical protein [Thermosipho ferrireducens]QTA37970.1 hypothetical protein JYK00_09695 [Thermosipho ferrireducens]